MKRLELTVGMPVRNGELGLETALRSIQNQDYPATAIHVSLNACQDLSESIAKRLGSDDPRVHVQNVSSCTATQNFSRLVANCKTDLFMWAAHDDVWAPHFTSSLVPLLENGADFAMSNWWVGNIKLGLGYQSAEHPLAHVFNANSSNIVDSFRRHPTINHKANLIYGIYRTDFLKKHISSLDLAEDTRFIELLLESGRGEVIDDVLFFKDFKGNRLTKILDQLRVNRSPARERLVAQLGTWLPVRRWFKDREH